MFAHIFAYYEVYYILRKCITYFLHGKSIVIIYQERKLLFEGSAVVNGVMNPGFLETQGFYRPYS
jgi:hypothetical protein